MKNSIESISYKYNQKIFVAGLALFIVIKMGMIIVPLTVRSAPLETDDAYAYILKAAQMRHCFFQDCASLVDLNEQLSTTIENKEISSLRTDYYTRVFLVYHPLYSAALASLNMLGFDWETAFNLVSIFGAVIIFVSIGCVLHSYFGPGSAGIALILLTLYDFPGQGLLYVVPSNIALAAFFLTVAVFPVKGKWHGLALSAGVAIMLSLHVLGLIYSTIAIFMYLILSKKPLTRQNWYFAGLSVFFILVKLTLPFFITKPDLRNFNYGVNSENPELANIIKDNFYPAWQIVDSWSGLYIHPSAIILALVLSVFFIPKNKRRYVITFLVVIFVTLLASLLHYFPLHPATMFSRIWAIAVILLTALISSSIWGLICLLLACFRKILKDSKSKIKITQILISSHFTTLIVITILVVVLANWGGVYQRGISAVLDLRYKIEGAIIRYDIKLDKDQINLMFEKLASSDVIVYTHQILMYYYLSNGAFNNGLVFLGTDFSNEERLKWVDNNKNIRYIVSRNPIEILPNASSSSLLVRNWENVELRGDNPLPINSIYLLLENRSEHSINIEMYPVSDKGVAIANKILIELPSGWNGWKHFGQNEVVFPYDKFAVKVLGENTQVTIKGIRLEGSNKNLLWPWNQGISIAYKIPFNESFVKPWQKGIFVQHSRLLKPKEKERVVKFDTSNIIPGFNRDVTIINDNGYSVLSMVL